MPKLTPQLPLLPDKTQPGFQLIEDYRTLVQQNMKMVLLTNPGERVMMPGFGVGLNGLLFENMTDPEMTAYYQGQIQEQVKRYLPYVELIEANFREGVGDTNRLAIEIRYYIPALELEDVLSA